MTESDSNRGLAVKINAVLSRLGSTLASEGSGILWHAEAPRSRLYPLVALLVFASAEQPEEELAVVSVEMEPQRARLQVDITGHGSVLIAATEIDASRDAGLVADALARFLWGHRQEILAAITGGAAG